LIAAAVLLVIGGVVVGVLFGVPIIKTGSSTNSKVVVLGVASDASTVQASQSSFSSDIAFAAGANAQISKVVADTSASCLVYVTLSGSSADVATATGLLSAAAATGTIGSFSVYGFSNDENNVASLMKDNTAAPTTAPPTSAAPTTFALRINCGSAFPYTDSVTGNVFSADTDVTIVSGGVKYTNKAPTGNNLVDTERYYTGVANDGYHIPVANGNYKVTLFMAELNFNTTGSRTFYVNLEGSDPFGGIIDVYARAGAQFALTKLSATAAVTDGMLDITFLKVKQNPFVNGIEIVNA